MAGNARGSPDLALIKQTVEQKFAEIRGALQMREKLLMRQIEVIEQQQVTRNNAAAMVTFLPHQEEELLTEIRKFGRFQLDNINLALQDVYLKNEDYIVPNNDHETMDKCLQQTTNGVAVATGTNEESPEAIVVDFSKNKSLIEHNRKNMYDSIINITLHEAKELIRKAKLKHETPIPPLNLEELDDELESSIAEAMSSLGGGRDSVYTNNTKSSQTCVDNAPKKSKKNRFKPKITINNCNGTINLRNISSLTINCATEESVSAEIPVQTQPKVQEEEDDDESPRTPTQCSKYSKNTPKTKSGSTTIDTMSTSTSTSVSASTSASSSNDSSNASSRSQSKKQKSGKKHKNTPSQFSVADTINTKLDSSNATNNSIYPYELVDETDAEVTCDFYNRLLNEIKNSLKDKSKHSGNDNNWIRSSPMVDDAMATLNNECSGPRTATTDSSLASTQAGKRLILKNFENLKIVLEANSDEETLHPVQIEQWLAEIISETDLEPMQNTDILEHSQINSETT